MHIKVFVYFLYLFSLKMALMGTDFQSSILPQKIDTFLLKVQLWAIGANIRKSDRQFNFYQSWEHFVQKKVFSVAPTQEAVEWGGGPLAHLAS